MTRRGTRAGAIVGLAWTVAIVACGGGEVGADSGPVGDAGRLDAPPIDGARAAEDAPRADALQPDDGGPPVPTSGCAPLAAPAGAMIRVTPAQAAELPTIVRDAAPGTTILLADGTYTMSGDESARRIQVRAAGITLRSESGDPASVVIDGEYATNEIIGIHAPDVTIAELTITHAVDHGIHVTPPDGGPDVTGTHLYRVRVLDCGEQFVKVNPPGARDAWTDDGVVECSYFEMTDEGRPNVERATGGCYTGGIDAHASRGWIVRDNEFVGIYCAGEGLAEHAIHFWVSSRDTLVERNVIRECARGIGLGLVESGATRAYDDDPSPGIFVGHHGGIVRNNVIVATIPYYDTGIELAQARGTLVVHNTIVESDAATGRFSSIDSRFGSSITTIRNNLVERITVRDGATSTADHNLEDVPISFFVDGLAGDVHLTAGATGAIDQGVEVAESGLDIDGEAHDRGAAPDLGADER
jgi:hypothetical protein